MVELDPVSHFPFGILESKVGVAFHLLRLEGSAHPLHLPVALWVELAARRGNVYAPFYVGIMFLEDRGCDKDIDLAVKWLNIAAKNGYEAAKKVLDDIEKGKI